MKVFINNSRFHAPKKTCSKESNKVLNSLEKSEKFIADNPIMGRVVIELISDVIAGNIFPYLFGAGRSYLLAIENTLGSLLWAAFGIVVPIHIIKGLLVGKNSPYTKKLKDTYKMSSLTPLETKFAKLDKFWLNDSANQELLAGELGLENKTEVLSVANKIKKGKLAGMAIDMFVLASVSSGIYALRNWLTWMLSGKKEGFSGEFTYAKDEYIKKKSDEMKKSESLRQMLGTIVGFLGNMSAPLLCYLILRSKKNFFGKSLIPAMEYTNGIYMSRWLLAFHIIFNYNFKQIFAFARSTNEIIESAIKAIGFDFLFFIGDDIISGLSALYFQNQYKSKLGDLKLTERGFLGLTLAKPLEKIQKEIKDKPNSHEIRELVSKLTKYNFRIGLSATSVLIGFSLSTISALQTKMRVEQEENKPKTPAETIKTQFNKILMELKT